MPDEMNMIHICKYCGEPEYYGEFRWLSGKMCCRNCYKTEYESQYHKPYTWEDLDGPRPTKEKYELQKVDMR